MLEEALRHAQTVECYASEVYVGLRLVVLESRYPIEARSSNFERRTQSDLCEIREALVSGYTRQAHARKRACASDPRPEEKLDLNMQAVFRA